MHKFRLALPGVAILFAVTAASASVYAGDTSDATMNGGKMKSRGMMGQMTRMMGGCDAMMHGGNHSGHPNEQRRDAPGR
jgi:hypothetical protein